MTAKTPCPCGSGLAYRDCCGPFIEGRAIPDTALRLMRSRYSAYALGHQAWIAETWHPSTRPCTLELGEAVRWLDLKVLATEAGGPQDDLGVVEFVARYRVGGRAHRLHERSRFRRLDGRWYYLDGDLGPEAAAGPRPE
jgi:SEC-C motif-containing protein